MIVDSNICKRLLKTTYLELTAWLRMTSLWSLLRHRWVESPSVDGHGTC